MRIVPADLDAPDVCELIRFHHADLHARTPSGFAFAFDVARLRAPGIHVLAAYDGGELVGIGALAVTGREGELKSMRTVADRLRTGVATALLDALTATGRSNGVRSLYLETGTGPHFEPAWRFYLRHGFEPCGPFRDYRESPFNRFMHKAI